MSTPTKLVTADELLHMPDDGYKYELVDGRIERMPPPKLRHGVIAARLAIGLGRFVDEHKLGAVATEVGYKLASDPDTVRGPDLSFVSSARIEAGLRAETYWEAAPDLVVEVLSPDDRSSRVARKIQDYLRLGVRMTWVIQPRDRSVTVYRPDESPVILGTDQDLDGHDIIPGFRYPIHTLFD